MDPPPARVPPFIVESRCRFVFVRENKKVF